MKSNLLFSLLLLMALMVLPSIVLAQSSGMATGVRSYKKIVADTMRMRVAGAGPVKKAAVAGSVKPRVKRSAPKIDSLSITPRVYVLGERMILLGDSGRDVRSVAKILINKLYIDEESLTYTAGGGVLYDEKLQRAVKHFQEFNGFYPDGIIGQDLIKALRKRK
jgi:hypothetical protein